MNKKKGPIFASTIHFKSILETVISKGQTRQEKQELLTC